MEVKLSGLLASILKTYIVAAILMFFVWGVYLFTKNPTVVDVAWVLGIFISGVLYFTKFSHIKLNYYHYLTLVLLGIWTIRLGGFLFITRVLPGHIDPRYVDIKNSIASSESLNFLMNFQLQAFLLTIVASCMYFIANFELKSNIILHLGFVLIILGIIGESLADYQLYSFKQNNTSLICDVGLWQYSRHPNYFFELITWLGFGVIGIQSSGNLLALVSPVWLFCIMYYFTIPITEQHILEKKPEAYSKYKQETNKLVPVKIK